MPLKLTTSAKKHFHTLFWGRGRSQVWWSCQIWRTNSPGCYPPLAVPGGLTQVVVTALVGTEALSKGFSQPHFHVILKELPGLRAGGVSLTLPNKSSKATVTCLRPQTAISRGRAQRLKLDWYLLNRSCNISASSFVPLKMFWVLKKV